MIISLHFLKIAPPYVYMEINSKNFISIFEDLFPKKKLEISEIID